MKEVTIYTDGACSGNPGPGGWAAILIYNNIKKEISGGSPQTTNNIMEMTAIIEGLKMLKEKCKVNIYSDSAYVINAFHDNWIDGWIKKGWVNSKKEPVKNRELWEQLLPFFKDSRLTFRKTKGHSDDKWNNMVDRLAVEAKGV